MTPNQPSNSRHPWALVVRSPCQPLPATPIVPVLFPNILPPHLSLQKQHKCLSRDGTQPATMERRHIDSGFPQTFWKGEKTATKPEQLPESRKGQTQPGLVRSLVGWVQPQSWAAARCQDTRKAPLRRREGKPRGLLKGHCSGRTGPSPTVRSEGDKGHILPRRPVTSRFGPLRTPSASRTTGWF